MVAMPSVTSTSIDMSRLPALAAEQVARDHHAMHLGWPFADALNAHLAIPAFQRHFARDAEPAEHLNAAVDHLAGDFGRIHFANRGIDLDVLPEVTLPGGLIDEQPRGTQLDLRVRDHPLDRLLVGKPRAERFALLGPVDRKLQCRLRDADHRRRVGDARVNQPGFGQLEAFAFIAEAVVLRDLAILQADLVGKVRADDRHRLVRKALEVLFDDEGRHAVAALAAGAREHESPVRLADAGDPELGAVENVAVAAFLGAGLDRAARVGAAARLGDRHEGFVSVLYRRHRILFDLVLAAEENRVGRVVAKGMTGRN